MLIVRGAFLRRSPSPKGCAGSGPSLRLLGSHPHTGPGMQGGGDEREGAARRVGGAQLVSGEPSLSAIRATLVTQVRVSCLVFTLAFAHTQSGWQVGQGGQRVGESGFQGETLPPRSGVMFWGQVTSMAGSPAPTQGPHAGIASGPLLGLLCFLFSRCK